MFHPIPAAVFCFTLCVLSLLGTTQGTYHVRCCTGSTLINNRCVCNTGYHGDSAHHCIEPCWNKCKANADCNKQTFKCYCRPGFVGNPYVGCTRKAAFEFAQSSYVVKESDGVVKLKVVRTGGLHKVIVKWQSTSITAKLNSDYKYYSGSVTFGVGERSKFIQILIVNDQIYEQTETFKVTLTSASPWGVIGGTSVTTVTITDDDLPCGGKCKNYRYSYCNRVTNRCVCQKNYYGNPYNGGCKCGGGGGY